MKYCSWFSGIGGFELGLEPEGHECCFSCEINKNAGRIYEARFGRQVSATDITSCAARDVPEADLWVGGFPCQDVSVAGKRGGLQANRSGLVWRLLDLAAVRRPRWILLENVSGLLSMHRGADLRMLLDRMADIWPAVGFRVVDAQFFGVPQQRRRVFIAGGPGAEGVAQVLFEPQGRAGDPPKGRASRQDVAFSLTASPRGTGDGHGNANNTTYVTGPVAGGPYGSGRRSEDDPNLVVGCLGGRGSGGPDDNDAQGGHLVVSHQVSPTLDARCADGPRRAQGGVMILQENQRNEISGKDKASTIKGPQGKGQQMIAGTLGTDRGYPRSASENIVSHALTNQRNGRLDPNGEDYHVDDVGIRRLTPTEMERLQGFPDGHSCLCSVRPDCPDRRIPPWVDPSKIRLDGCGHSVCGCRCPDGPRAKALGNAVAVPVIRYFAERFPKEVK